MKRQLLPLLLALSLLCAVSIPALAAVEDTGFSDVRANAWYAKAVAYVRDNGLMSGTSAITFAPDAIRYNDGIIGYCISICILYNNVA